MEHGTWQNFAAFSAEIARDQKTGRPSLRRQWAYLRALAEEVRPSIPDEVVEALIGKNWDTADPEHNDLKAIVSYAVGQGFIQPEAVRDALSADDTHSPLYWLAGLSGKAFGESVAPKLVSYWIVREGDGWVKRSGSEYYDMDWIPAETGRVNRIELKASSENPGFRFQQIRDPRFTGAGGGDYDTLLCVGVTASTMEFWSIPMQDVGRFIDDGTFANQHGGGKMKSNTFWFVTDQRMRETLKPFYAEAVHIRDLMLEQERT